MTASPLRLAGYVELPAHIGKGGFDHAAVHAASGHVYVAHTANDAIDVFDPASRRHLFSVPGLPGVAGALVSDEAELVFSSNRGEPTRSASSRPGPNPTVRKFDVGVRPNGLAYDHRRQLVLAANVGDPAVPDSYTLSMIDLDGQRQRAEIAVRGRTRWAVFDPEADLFFVNIMEPSRDRRGRSAASPTGSPAPSPCPHAGAHGLDFDPATRRLFCACDAGVLVTLDAASGKVLDEQAAERRARCRLLQPPAPSISTSRSAIPAWSTSSPRRR